VARAFPGLALADGHVPSTPAWPEHLTTRHEIRAKAQTALALAFPGPARTDRRRYAAEVMTAIASGLGGRFFEQLRDRQSLAYTVHVQAVQRSRAGAFLAYIATSPDKEDAARRGLLAEFARLREEHVTEEELHRSRNYLVGSHAIARQSGGAVLGELVEAWLLGEGLAELDDYERSIRSVTAADIRSLARDLLHEERRVEGLVRGGAAS
jgi:zinc protease